MATTKIKTKFGELDVSADVLAGDFDSLPVVDLQPMYDGDLAARKQLAREVRDACCRVGFFYIKNHGVDPALVQALHDTAHRYFDLPLEKKLESWTADQAGFRGYEPLLASKNGYEATTGDLSEAFNIGYELEADPLTQPGDALPDDPSVADMYRRNVWPREETLPGFRAAFSAYYGAVLTLGRRLLRVFALALELPEGYFDKLVTHPGCMSRIIHYPPQPVPDGQHEGIAAHTDYECFTILSQDGVRALQVLNSANQWIQAEPLPDHFVVNIGDFFKFWTNGLFRSTLHRVTNLTGRNRYSIPFFFGINYDAVISVLDTCVDAGAGAATTKPVKAGDYVRQQLNDVYKGDSTGTDTTVEPIAVAT